MSLSTDGHFSPEEPGDSSHSGAWYRRLFTLVPAVVVLAVLAVLTMLALSNRPDLKRGVWLSQGNNGRLVLEFRDSSGLMAGTVHELREGRELVQWGFLGQRRGESGLKLNWGSGIQLEGTFDLPNGIMESRIFMPDGTAREAHFERTEAEAVPGLLALSERPYRLRRPAAGSGWEVASPAGQGIDPGCLESTVQAVARGDAGLIHSLIIVRHGRLLLEEYFHGYERDDLHPIQSCTKSIASLLIGIASDLGKITTLDAPVFDFFPEHADLRTPQWDRVTLRHILTMSAGLDWKPGEVLNVHGTGPAFFRMVLARSVAKTPGEHWRYVGADVNLLAGVLRHATGLHADKLASRYLFEPLGIEVWDWEAGAVEGYRSMDGSLRLRPLDMARLGQLVLDEGQWQGKQVVSAEWIRESTAKSMLIDPGTDGYGYLWWRLPTIVDGVSHTVIVAVGWGTQFIHVAPAFDAVIVTTGGNQFNGQTYAIGEVLMRHLVPGMKP